MKDSYRKRVEQNVRNYILHEMYGEMPELAALLAEFDALEREVETLRAENEELRKRAFRLNEDLPGEEWRDVVGYKELYQVSNFGRVKSLYRGRNVICSLSGKYLTVHLYKDGRRKTFRVHRLVAQAFIPNPDNKPIVHHDDNNGKNNYIENLQWVTESENQRFAYIDGVKLSCSPRRKLLSEDVR